MDHELLQAVSTNDSARIKQLLKDGANPNAHFSVKFCGGETSAFR
jgi:hypothetical protein